MIWKTATCQKKITGTIFLNFHWFFDTTERTLLLDELRIYELCGAVLE